MLLNVLFQIFKKMPGLVGFLFVCFVCLFPKLAILFYIPTSSVSEFHFFHILNNLELLIF